MGRSVDYPCNAEWVVYLPFEYDDPDDAQWRWECFEGAAIEALKNAFPSCSIHRPLWDGEAYSILGNGHGDFYLSEYCGLVSLSFKLDEETAIGEHWAQQALAKVRKVFAGRLYNKIATMSNGEGVYERLPA